ncbi:MAG: long-chain-fatty-acid--CoA ligase [Zetaproteobacteria bacterium]|nr:long-chain-fatty-acid--CoA ligase [Pseudobdellovibrionaceae bacterium]|tara:strand:+ start:115 stop:1785 length:1671 start_codon:yes stop_codon:yes gene_type:complete
MDKIWLKNYPAQVNHEINEKDLPSLQELVESSLNRFSSLPAYTCMGKTLSFEEINHLTSALGSYLINELKLKAGDRVGIMMPNVLQNPISILSVIRAGLVVVNINPLYTERELKHQLKDSGAKAIIILENFAHVLSSVVEETQVKHTIITKIGDLLGGIKGSIVNFVIKNIKKMVPKYNIPSAIGFNAAIASGKNQKFKSYTVAIEDPAFLQYTGGTTGVSKGAVLSHKNISANVSQASSWLTGYLEEEKEVVITALPLYHIFSLTANCLLFLKLGGHNILIPNPKDLPTFIKSIAKTHFTVITGVNTLYNALMNHPDFNKIDFSALKISLGGGMAVQETVAKKWKQLTKTPLIEAYGLTETSPAACINPLNIKDYNGSIGLPLPSTLATIRDENNHALAHDQRGELCLKGPQVMSGYWKNDEETRKSFTEDGWLRTGDIAIMDKEGYITLVDRKKDMILVSGFNVYPNEVEDVISKHPKVFEVAAIGVPSEKSGEEVKVCIVKKDPSLSKDEVLSFSREHLTGYKVPKHVDFREELPKTNVGKILRRSLKEEQLH